MVYLASRTVGAILIGLAIYIGVQCVRLLDLSREFQSHVLPGPVPENVRVGSGIAGLVLFCLPMAGFGLRLLVRPKRLNEEI